MKFYKTLNQYKASNVMFDVDTLKAFSYQHWCFVREVNGKLVFNNHAYSNTTQRHQQKVRRLLDSLGLTIDLEVDSRPSLNSSDWQEASIKSLEYKIKEVQAQLENPKRHKRLDRERLDRIAELKSEMRVLVEFLESI
jgi:hypothetical protein